MRLKKLEGKETEKDIPAITISEKPGAAIVMIDKNQP